MTQEFLSATDIQNTQEQSAFLSADLGLDFSAVTPGAQEKEGGQSLNLDFSGMDAASAPVPRDAAIAAQTLKETLI